MKKRNDYFPQLPLNYLLKPIVNNSISHIVIAITIVFCQSSCVPRETKNAETDSPREATPKKLSDWFTDARFGMFIHWGAYSVPGGEWAGSTKHGEWIMLSANMTKADYESNFVQKFNPEKFDADEWVEIAINAGMKYMVFTAKHHDGFCMFDSEYTDFDIVDATPFKRDPVKELSEACKKAGIKFCLYYSLPDWTYPDYDRKYSILSYEQPNGFHANPKENPEFEKYIQYVKNQLTELLTNYGDVGIIWFDHGSAYLGFDTEELLSATGIYDHIKSIQPDCIVNDRLEKVYDYRTPEGFIPNWNVTEPFETCMTLNKHWGYNKADDKWKSPADVIGILTKTINRGGNLLLNVGPTGEGEIPLASVDILNEVGAWMKLNGEAIHGAHAPKEFKVPECWEGQITLKGNKVYVVVNNYRGNGQLMVRRTHKMKVKKAYFLADKEQKPLPFVQNFKSTMIEVPKEKPYDLQNVVVMEVEHLD